MLACDKDITNWRNLEILVHTTAGLIDKGNIGLRLESVHIWQLMEYTINHNLHVPIAFIFYHNILHLKLQQMFSEKTAFKLVSTNIL